MRHCPELWFRQRKCRHAASTVPDDGCNLVFATGSKLAAVGNRRGAIRAASIAAMARRTGVFELSLGCSDGGFCD
jgi:hypothetical protein